MRHTAVYSRGSDNSNHCADYQRFFHKFIPLAFIVCNDIRFILPNFVSVVSLFVLQKQKLLTDLRFGFIIEL